jgi:hypothetical protein
VTPVPKQSEVLDPNGGGPAVIWLTPDLCIPSPPPDLDWRYVYDQGFRYIRVLPPDSHILDRNHDGVACEGG